MNNDRKDVRAHAAAISHTAWPVCDGYSSLAILIARAKAFGWQLVEKSQVRIRALAQCNKFTKVKKVKTHFGTFHSRDLNSKILRFTWYEF